MELTEKEQREIVSDLMKLQFEFSNKILESIRRIQACTPSEKK